MSTHLQPSQFLAIWMNEYRREGLTRRDLERTGELVSPHTDWAAISHHVSESNSPIVGITPEPGNFKSAPSQFVNPEAFTQGVIACGHRYLFIPIDNDWHIVEHHHTIAADSPSHARREFMGTLASHTQLLESLATVGNRADSDDATDAFTTGHLPASVTHEKLAALELAGRIRAIASFALTESEVPSSPSADQQRVVTLREIKSVADAYLTALVSS